MMIENFTPESKVYRSQSSICNGIKVLLNFIPDFLNIEKPLDFGKSYFNIYYKGNCYIFCVKIARKQKYVKRRMKEAINEVMTISKKYAFSSDFGKVYSFALVFNPKKRKFILGKQKVFR